MNFSWAECYPEVHKICTLFTLTELSAPHRYSYKPLAAFLQDGPQCGLVALAIYSGNPSTASVQSLLETAKNEGFTNNGEMFSVQNMATLARLSLKSTSVQVYSGLLNTKEIKEFLLNGAHLLVPYDTDKDNSPGLLNGSRAHWAIICGAVETESDFYVIARHGKAINVAIWKLSDLSESNAQLNEVGTYQKQPNIDFKLPQGGIQGDLGLKCKSIILKENIL
ncbi:UPF0692 protein CG33108 [Tribolium madens]|uniref:UPF0692 protein CG33108 n=1 Tax=Tribolium madens TaxID=41895 RepID=UPI001CF72EE6|nr:UPF0692 protein CG33108 [Tribolium madens]XP_044264914.1 UPF0692 protein CG33108 [Tribolium madens]